MSNRQMEEVRNVAPQIREGGCIAARKGLNEEIGVSMCLNKRECGLDD
jgi:hypothetical protein